MKILSKLIIGAVFLGGTSLGNAQQELFSFDDQSPVLYMIIPDGYGGLGWNGFLIANASELDPTGSGMVSSPNVALNSFGQPASFHSSSPLTLDSAWFTSVYASQDQLTVQGFAGASELYSNTFTIYHDTSTLINFAYAGVDSVQFSTAAGAYFTMDNMMITIPEPDTCALMSVAVALGGFGCWRKWIQRNRRQ